ncbi:MAG: FixH family protein [Acetobacteraceae bacterium]
MRTGPERRSAWIPWTFAALMGVVVAVNAVMVWFALSTFTGTTVDRSFERGRLYNTVIAEAERQRAIGWRFDLAYEHGVDERGRLIVLARDQRGEPLDRLAFEAIAVRPLERPQPIPLALVETARGRYVAELTLPRRGQWELHLAARRGEVGPVEVRERIVVP